MRYEPMTVRDCQSEAELRATYLGARQRLTAAGRSTQRLREVLPERPTEIKTCGTATGSMWLGLDPEGLGPRSIRGSDIISAALKVTQVRRNEFMSHRRSRHIAEARQLAYYFMHRFTRLSLPHIGKLAGGRDHSTVTHGIRRVTTEPEVFGARVALIAEELGVALPREDAVE